MNNDTSSQVANPFSTANGGVTFEQLVATSYLVSLLAGHIPRGLDWGITKEVRFQTKWSQCLLDDIVVIGTDGKAERKLALQIKHDVTFSASDPTFARVIEECWKTFAGASGWQFNTSTDRLGIGIGVYQTKVARHFQPLLEWARTSKNANEFLNKISVPHFSSKEKREYIEIIKTLLTKAKGSNVSDDELWQFLKCLVVFHFDLEYPGSRDSVHCWNCLLDQMKARGQGQAETLLNTLTSVVAEYARSAGSLDLDTLKRRIPVDLKDYPDFVSDLNHLRNHSSIVLDSIRDTIGEKVHLLRVELVDNLEAVLRENEVVVITGEPMVGKSVLLKLLANRLRSEGEVIALSVDRFFGVTLENFLHNIHVQSDFQDILSAVGNAPLRCILIDGLERVLVEEDKKRILNDLIIAVRNYNESVLSKGGDREYCWKIVLACRALELKNVLINLETRRNLTAKSLEKIEVGSLTDEEMTEVVGQIPRLKTLVSQERLKGILSRPLVLDILTLPDISLPPEEVPPILTETWLLEWFWRQVVRLGEELRLGRGSPEKRERVLIHIGEQLLRGEKSVQISDDMDSEAISGLVSDRLLVMEDSKLRFAHDVVEDWTYIIILSQKEDIPGFLKQNSESIHLTRAIRLYVSKFLEIEQSPSAWLDILTALEKESTLSPRWYRHALIAPLSSPLLEELLPLIEPYLLENNAILLSEFLKALRTICVQPDPKAHLIFGDLPQKEYERYLVYWVIPIWNQWIPVIQIVLQNADKLSDECLFEFSYVAEKWMTNTEGDQLCRKEIAELGLEFLNERFLRRDSTSALGYEKNKKLRENLIKSVLWAVDCLPDQIDNFVKQKALRSRDNGYYGFEEIILEIGWIPLCQHLPETAVNILEAILCRKLVPDRYGSYHSVFMDLGIKSTGWVPPTYLEGPFLGLLRFHSDDGLDLIHRVVNHATRCWRMREELDNGRRPLSQTVRLKDGPIEVWGDEVVYYWYRYPSVAPAPVTCALMALEYWMNEQLKNEADPQELFEKVLKNTKSVAVVGVCSSMALANYKICREVIVPILENPAFWVMDIHRFIQDMTAGSSTEMLSTNFSSGHGKSNHKILLDLAKQLHRKLHINFFVPFVLLYGPEEIRERLQEAMRAFPDRLPFFFEDEKENKELVRERKEACTIWAAQTEPKNYDVIKETDGKIIRLEFRLPEELEKHQKEKLKPLEKASRLYGFLGWVMFFLDRGEVGQAFTMKSAMQYVQGLICQDDPSYQPINSFEDSEFRAQAIAAFAAALVIREWSWIEENDYVLWCREQLLIAARRPELPPVTHEERFSQGYRRSAARALPILLSKYPEDKEIHEAVFTLALHETNEVRTYLYNGLKLLWTVNQETIWECIDLAIKASRKKAHENRFWYQNRSLRERVHSLSIKLFRKPIRDCSPEEIDTYHLQSMLLCLPSDSLITRIEPKDRLINFLEGLLHFTIRANLCHQDRDTNSMKGFYNRWNDLLFRAIANALLYLPPSVTEPKFYTQIKNNWEKAPVIMEKLLWYLNLIGSQPELGDRMIQIWPSIGNDVLSSDCIKEPKHYNGNEIRNILGLLIFAGLSGKLEWKTQEWKPLKNIIPFINRWCDAVGYRSDCFLSLVRLLRAIGFDLIPEYGINWLHSCISRTDNYRTFLERSRVNTPLAELLNDSWLTYGTTIKQDPETFRQFTFLVDILEEQGEPTAVQLQRKMLEDC